MDSQTAASFTNECSERERQSVLESLPQKPPFLFLDRIIELSENHIVAERRFREDEDFYRGHFPGDPVTPGVILVETMAQAGLVALGIYLLQKEGKSGPSNIRTLFSECSVEFFDMIRPNELVTVRGERIFWRRNKLKSKVSLFNGAGKLAAEGVVSGVGVIVE